MNIKNILIGAIVMLAVGFSIGRYTVPTNLQENTSVEQEKKTEETVIVKEEIKPDGTITKETTKTKKKEDSMKKEESVVIVNEKPNWKVALMTGYNFDKKSTLYGITVDRRVLGNISVGVGATTDKQALLTVGMEF